ncbi:MAG: stage II sporulation protein M [Blastocatellia bacterium]
MAENFIEKRKANWKRLEELVDQIRSVRGLRSLKRDEVRELGRIYRRAATDLAIARVESRDQRLVSYLNNLVIRAHGMIYRSEPKGVRSILDFYWHEFPAIFRRTYKFTLAAFLIFIVIGASSAFATWRNDDFADFAYLPPQMVQAVKGHQRWWERLNDEAPIGAAGIIANNIGVSLKVFAFSIVPVVGTVNVLTPSALQIGSLQALLIKYRMMGTFWNFGFGHAVLEFAAIFIASGAGLMIGLSLVAPGERTRREALIESSLTAIRLMVGCIPLLVIAGLIEGFISPLPLQSRYKIAVSVATAVMLAAYLLKPARRELKEQ